MTKDKKISKQTAIQWLSTFPHTLIIIILFNINKYINDFGSERKRK